jgi:predicted DNA binding protein
MVTARLEITPPASEWFVQLSTEHPNDEFTLLTLYNDESELLGIFEAETDDPDALLCTLNDIESITGCDLLHTAEGFAVIEYSVTESRVYSATVASGTLPPASVTVRDGVLFVEIRMPHNRLAGTIEAIEAIGGSCELLSLSRSDGIDDLLTDAQQRFMTEAVTQGYYDTPRACTLTELAS